MIGDGRHKGSTSASGQQSWRSLAGAQRSTRIKSPQARKRRQTQLLKLFSALFLFFLLVGLVMWAVIAFKNRKEPIQITTPSKPVEKVLFDTNGVLPSSWLGTVIELRRDTTMMEIDIYTMKQQLEAHGQVKSASVERQFPNALKIEIKEHEPVMRMRVVGSQGEPELRIVSRDGTIYKGVGYPKATLSKLPYVVPYRHPEGGFKPLRGIDKVADLLEVARRTQPNFYKTWQLVSLEHYSGDSEMPGQVIEVRTPMVPRLIFGFNTSFEQQLDRLSVILNYVQSRGNPGLKRIDLSLQGSAAVQFVSGRIRTF
ncbi:FtsQ-type POTRA domain-containing protein [Coraliomargarita algicola]|uniref:FtsQ-type POTRA domain-containing protein n=1 Tax=Coraliomargarita algicola TaxID=3092156 RepID=A0ABZ0RJC7_9BACT|nr:FtsQ-type POTRA domain-containing protein [Coraliomargarita sp. J2-16]WPJ94895.1 FtsQ-type POTRA domain-containing protein [Coraliomargarita sp. J2-16]